MRIEYFFLPLAITKRSGPQMVGRESTWVGENRKVLVGHCTKRFGNHWRIRREYLTWGRGEWRK